MSPPSPTGAPLDLFEDGVTVEVRYSADDNHGSMSHAETFSKDNPPPVVYRCPDAVCGGQGFVLAQAIRDVVEQRVRQMRNGVSSDPEISVVQTLACRGHWSDRTRAGCYRTFRVEIRGRLASP
jgi:hypothetical protein